LVGVLVDYGWRPRFLATRRYVQLESLADRDCFDGDSVQLVRGQPVHEAIVRLWISRILVEVQRAAVGQIAGRDTLVQRLP
jgi:hypothetical protein